MAADLGTSFLQIAVELIIYAIRITIGAIRASVLPLRFLVSPRFRRVCRLRWRDNPRLRAREVTIGAVSFAFFAAVMSGWTWLFAHKEPKPAELPPPMLRITLTLPHTATPTPAQTEKSEKSEKGLLEKLREFREKHRQQKD